MADLSLMLEPAPLIMMAALLLMALWLARGLMGDLWRGWRLGRLAAILGMRYLSGATWSDKYLFLFPGCSRLGRRIRHIVFGRRGELDFEAFDLECRAPSGRRIGQAGVVAARVPIILPYVIVRPRVAGVESFPIDRVTLEHAEFAAAYEMKSTAPDAARQLLSALLLEYLVESARFEWHIDGNQIVLHRPGRLSAKQIFQAMQMIEGFVARIPEEIRRMHGFRGLRIAPESETD